jgi:hypothetical protein
MSPKRKPAVPKRAEYEDDETEGIHETTYSHVDIPEADGLAEDLLDATELVVRISVQLEEATPEEWKRVEKRLEMVRTLVEAWPETPNPRPVVGFVSRKGGRS